jgi:hypothetical protein
MEETVYLDENNVMVTNTRFSAEGRTFPLSNVSSVRSVRKDPPRQIPIVIGLAALLAFIDGRSSNVVILGVLLLASAAGLWFFQKPNFMVMLSTPTGETKALSSRDNGHVSKIIAALHSAIIHRG